MTSTRNPLNVHNVRMQNIAFSFSSQTFSVFPSTVGDSHGQQLRMQRFLEMLLCGSDVGVGGHDLLEFFVCTIELFQALVVHLLGRFHLTKELLNTRSRRGQC
mmetsp:Transcript_2224/g.7059  ORF Transcript_2224/g.7059 Transcript_2224/m.7059 type:complete len:103 (+) Transcript_2224:173-481(+)